MGQSPRLGLHPVLVFCQNSIAVLDFLLLLIDVEFDMFELIILGKKSPFGQTPFESPLPELFEPQETAFSASRSNLVVVDVAP